MITILFKNRIKRTPRIVKKMNTFGTVTFIYLKSEQITSFTVFLHKESCFAILGDGIVKDIKTYLQLMSLNEFDNLLNNLTIYTSFMMTDGISTPLVAVYHDKLEKSKGLLMSILQLGYIIETQINMRVDYSYILDLISNKFSATRHKDRVKIVYDIDSIPRDWTEGVEELDHDEMISYHGVAFEI